MGSIIGKAVSSWMKRRAGPMCTWGPVPEEPSILEDDCYFVDDVNGGILPTEEVTKARSLEMDYLYDKAGCVPRCEAVRDRRGRDQAYRGEMD